MKSLIKLFASIGIVVLSGNSLAQSEKWLISGQLTDGETGEAVPYAAVIVHSSVTHTILNGITTNDQGNFNVGTDSSAVYLEIKSVGYIPDTIRTIRFNTPHINLGEIKLFRNNQILEQVQVTAERSTMEFKLDRRVYNVGSDISSTGMGALEILNNIPSVNVDIEGQISLRGNTGVQILIDGKPSVLADEQGNALGTITADMVERIEVITNPSAKYNAEGTSGIINIVLKKEEKKGINGSISLNTGYPNNHSIGGSLNLRTEKFNFFTQFGAGYRSMPWESKSTNRNITSGDRIESEGNSIKNENFYNITIGTDYHINERNVLTLSGNFAYELETNPTQTAFYLYDENQELSSSYNRTEKTKATNPKWQYDLQYQKTFKNNKEHILQFSTLGSFFGKDQSSDFENEYLTGIASDPSQRTATDFYQADYTFKLDYTNPLTKTITLETGALYEINDVGNDYSVDNQLGDSWIPDTSLTNNFEYNQKVLGIYTTGSYEGKKWGVKLGVRLENTDLKTLLTNTNERNTQNYTNFFPSLHTSYKISRAFSLQAGYSRRIFRPRLWDLNPFFNIRNTYNIRTGNPDLQPEFADSYELTGVFLFEKLSLNISGYYLYTTNVTERVSYFENNVNITTPINIGIRHKTGGEINAKYTATKWLTLNGEANYGYFLRKGVFENQNFDFEGSQWSGKLTVKFKLPADIDLEINSNYQSAYKTVQGKVSGFAFVDAGIRKRLWKGKGVINLSIRDIFASRIRESIVDQPSYYLYSFSKRGRFITLGFSYSFGKGEAMTYSGGKR